MANKNIKKVNSQKHKVEELLYDLMETTVEELVERIESGEASPQDISNAIRIMKENDIDTTIRKGKELGIIDNDEDLPFEGENVVRMDDKKGEDDTDGKAQAK